ncbi:MAG: oligosaccharide flippase family protein, partial [bacterium]
MYEKTNQIFKGAASYLTSGIVTSVGTFLVSILVSRYLGKEGLGIFSISLSVVLMGVISSEFGLNPLIMREFAAGGKPVRSLRSIFFIRFAASGVIAALVFVAGSLLHLANTTELILSGTALLIVSRST